MREVQQNWSHGDGAAPVGTKGWAERVRLTMLSMAEHLGEDEERLLGYVEFIQEHEAWKLLSKKDGTPFKTIEEFCGHARPWGLGVAWEEMQPHLAAGLATRRKPIDISKIRTDGGTQSRAKLDDAIVAEYAEKLDQLPPVTLFHDGESYWLADGFHRLASHRKGGRNKIAAVVHQGTQRDAILHSVGANSAHGLRRSNEDKRRAVEMLLRDEEWSRKSDRWIAEKCGVDQKTVLKWRHELEATEEIPQLDERTGVDGKTRKLPQRKTATEPAEPAPIKYPSSDEASENTPEGVAEAAPDQEPVKEKPKPDPAQWWDCPECRKTFNVASAKKQGWMSARKCGDCQADSDDGDEALEEDAAVAPASTSEPIDYAIVDEAIVILARMDDVQRSEFFRRAEPYRGDFTRIQ